MKVLTNLLLIMTVLLWTGYSTAFSKVKLRSLSNVRSKTFARERLNNSVIMIFQKDCVACKKQVKRFSCLDEDVRVQLVGSFATESELRDEAQKFEVKFPSFYGDQEALEYFNITNRLSPQILVFTEKKVWKFLGLTDCLQIKEALGES